MMLIQATLTALALTLAGTDHRTALRCAAKAHQDERCDALITERRMLFEQMERSAPSTLHERAEHEALQAPAEDLPELLARVEVARQLEAERFADAFQLRRRSPELVRRTDGRRSYLATLATGRLAERAAAAGLDGTASRASLIESLARHETAQLMTVEYLDAAEELEACS